MPAKQKAIYCAIVFGDLVPAPDGSGYTTEPQGKRDFQLTDPRVLDMIGPEGKKEFLDQAALAWEMLTADVRNGGLEF